MFDWDAELTDETRDEFIESIATRVQGYGVTSPAIFFLEMHKPLHFIAGQSVLLGSGILAPIFGAKNVQKMSKLLERRENVERLIQRIEEKALLPDSKTLKQNEIPEKSSEKLFPKA